MEPHRGSSRHTAHGSPPIAPPLHRMEEKTSRRLLHAILYTQTRSLRLAVRTSRRRRENRGYLWRVRDSDKLPKRVMFVEVYWGDGYCHGLLGLRLLVTDGDHDLSRLVATACHGFQWLAMAWYGLLWLGTGCRGLPWLAIHGLPWIAPWLGLPWHATDCDHG